MHYSNNTSPKNIEAAKRFEAMPPKQVKFSPVPFKLLQVAGAGSDHEQVQVLGPHCDTDYGDYAGAPFDMWHKGDLCAIKYTHRSTNRDMSRTEYATWYIGRRASTPSAVRAKYDIGGIRTVASSDPITLFRIPYRYLSRAAQLIGTEFESREALEQALDGAQSFAVAAE